MSRQQQQNLITTPSTSSWRPSQINRPRPSPELAVRFPPTPIPRPRSTHKPFPTDVDNPGQTEMTKARSTPENTWYQWWYYWSINLIPEFMKKSESNTKQNVIRLFETKIDDSIPRDTKPTKYRQAFEGSFAEYKSEKDKNVTMAEYLEKIRSHLRNMIGAPWIRRCI